ncbi:exocyst complex component 3-like protein 4 isoform 1-T3 [Pholidichthys leucotaenia]
MSDMMENSNETPGEDSVSIKSNGSVRSNESFKTSGNRKMRTLQSLKRSFRLSAEKSLRLPGGKTPKNSPKADQAANEPPSSPPPPSPSLSSVSLPISPVKSPKGQNKEEDEDVTPRKPLARSKTDPSMSKLRSSFKKTGMAFRRSLGGSKKDHNTDQRSDPFMSPTEGTVEEEEEEKISKEDLEEIEESYTLPEIPYTPLSVMEINKLIEMEVLEEAHLNLLALRQELQQEQHSEDLSITLAKKEKDLSLLYTDLRKKISDIVRDSNSFPLRNKKLLVPVARIIQEEEKRAEEPGGLKDSWMEAWREAVGEGVQEKVKGVHLQQREENTSWLAVHLGLLGQAIVEDLENVKRDLRWSYPPSFKVFSTYVKSYHRVVGQHLQKLEQEVVDAKDLYSLLDWIINRYKSEKILGSLSLQPDIQDESTDLQLEENFVKQLKDKYCRRIKEDMQVSLDRLIELEKEEVWMHKKTIKDLMSSSMDNLQDFQRKCVWKGSSDLLAQEEKFLESKFPFDIWTTMNGFVSNSQKIDPQLKEKVISRCLEELKHFPGRFEKEFRHHCSALKPQPLWTEYQITYINSFALLQQHMEMYQELCPVGVESFSKVVKGLIVRLMEELEEQFKEDVKPCLRRMMTRKWLTSDEDFKHLSNRIEQLSQCSGLMRPPHVQEFVNKLHYHVVKEYIGQLMEGKYSCKNQKHEKAATKIQQQWNDLKELFEEMKSSEEWLYPVGNDLSNIIGQKNTANIKNHLQPLVKNYPDFRRKHLVAVLHFRGLMRGREHRQILQQLKQLLKETGPDIDKRKVLFTDMEVKVNTACLPNLPFSCLNFCQPHNE